MSNRESELKFTCAVYDSPLIQQGLASVCLADQKFQENVISSVYFDTPDWLFAMEKASSDFLKTKVRLRWYQPVNAREGDASDCYLEFKRKIGSKRAKSRVKMPFKGNEALSSLQNQQHQELIQSCLHEHVPEFAAHQITPKFVVQYRRNRYFEPFSNTRVSFDREIQAYSVDNSAVFSSSSVQLLEAVLEVKGECDDLPISLRSIHPGKLKKAAFSKYFECFKLLTGYQQ